MFKIILELKILQNCTIHPEIIRNNRNADNLEHKMQGKNNAQETNALPKKKCLLKNYKFFEVAPNLWFCIFQRMWLNHIYY